MAYNNNNNKNTTTTRNPDNFLFKALTRLLSGPLTQYQRQNPRQLKRWQLDKYNFQSAGGLQFKKAHTARSTAFMPIPPQIWPAQKDTLISIKWSLCQNWHLAWTFMLTR